MTEKDPQDPHPSKKNGQEDVAAAVRVPIPEEVSARIEATHADLAREVAEAAKRVSTQSIVNDMVRDNPGIFGKAGRGFIDAIRATGLDTPAARSGPTSLNRAIDELRRGPSQIETVKLPKRPEPELLRRLIAQVKETDQHQAAILAIQQAEYERSQKRDSDDAARDRRDHLMQKWNLAVSSIAAVAGIVAIIVTVALAK